MLGIEPPRGTGQAPGSLVLGGGGGCVACRWVGEVVHHLLDLIRFSVRDFCELWGDYEATCVQREWLVVLPACCSFLRQGGGFGCGGGAGDGGGGSGCLGAGTGVP